MKSQLVKITLALIAFLAVIGIIFLLWGKTPSQQVSITKQEKSSAPTRIALISDIDRCASREFATRENLMRFVNFANTQEVDLGSPDFSGVKPKYITRFPQFPHTA